MIDLVDRRSPADSARPVRPAGAADPQGRQRLRVHGLTVGYPGRRGRARIVLDGIDADLVTGELTCLVGPNGAGKSTLLRSVAGLQPPLRGEVALDGRPMRSLDRRELAATLAVVLTDRFDPGRLRVCEVVAMGRYPRTSWTGRLTGGDHAVIGRCLALVGAADLATSEFVQLSDGQRQRVLVARALAQEPRVLLLDEPTAFLDPPGRLSLMMLLHQVASGQDVAILVCTHDIELASRYADRLWVANRDGGLITGCPEDLAYSGQLAASFTTDGVAFDLASLAFVAEQRDAPVAAVRGRGPAAQLAGHALRRAGYQISCTPDPDALAVTAMPGRWQATARGEATIHDSLGGLAEHARIVRRTRGNVPGSGCCERSLRVGLLHAAPALGESAGNLERLRDEAEKAAVAGAQVIVAPELAVAGYGFDSRAAAAPSAEPLTGPTVSALAELSRRRAVYCVFGLLERDEHTGLLYNTAVATGPDGVVVARHRKVAVAERRWATPGPAVQGAASDDSAGAGPAEPGSLSGSLFTTPWGTVGLLVCADSYWGTPARAHALRGADLLLVVANWPPLGLDPRLVWRARALDNGVPVVACNRTGADATLDFRDAHSYAVDADGAVLLDAASTESTTFVVEVPLVAGLVRQRRAAALAGRSPQRWGGLGLDVNGPGDRSWLWGTPPPRPVRLRATIPHTTIELDVPESAGVVRIAVDEQGPLLDTGDSVVRPAGSAPLVHVAGGFRVAVTGVAALRHPETAAALARQGCDLIAVVSGREPDEPTWAMLAARCLERVPLAVVTATRTAVYVPPEACEGWAEHTRTHPGTLEVCLDVAAGRRRHLFDRLDLETLCAVESGT